MEAKLQKSILGNKNIESRELVFVLRKCHVITYVQQLMA
jgi:hypothetical protein